MSKIYLYTKEHTITNMKYFGKTMLNSFDLRPELYHGSGKYWLRHIRKHDRQYVITTNVWSFEDQASATEFALKFSKENDIVESKEWANLKDEDAVNGGWDAVNASYFNNNSHPRLGTKHSDHTKQLMRAAKLGKKQSLEHIKKRVDKNTGQKRTEKQKAYYKSIRVYTESEREKRRINGLGRKHSEETLIKMRKPRAIIECPHCKILGGGNTMHRWHFENCKSNQSRVLL